MVNRAQAIKLVYRLLWEGFDNDYGYTLAAKQYSISTTTLQNYEREFRTEGHISVSHQGQYERTFLLDNEEWRIECLDWVRAHPEHDCADVS